MNPVDLNEKLSKNFRVREFVRSATAKRMGINNVLIDKSDAHRNAKALFGSVIQPVRDRLSAPLFVTSGFRCPELNAAVGGVEGSQHSTAEAADIASGRHSPMGLAYAFMQAEVPFDQLILEHDQDVVHVSHVREGENRGEVLTRFVKDGKLHYVTGLVSEAEAMGYTG